MMHFEMNYNSLAECYAKLRGYLTISDLGRKARVVVDIDETSPFDGSWIMVPESDEKADGKVVKLTSDMTSKDNF